MDSFGSRLHKKMKELGLTRKELAFYANVKIRALDMYLGKQASLPPADVAVRLAKALNVTVEYLVTGNNRQNSNDTKYLSIINSLKDFLKKIEIYLDNQL